MQEPQVNVIGKDPKTLNEKELADYSFMFDTEVRDLGNGELGEITGYDDSGTPTFRIMFPQGKCPSCGQMRQVTRDLTFEQFEVVGRIDRINVEIKRV